MKYAVIDISSSSISLVVADEKEAEPVFRARESLTLLHYLDGHALSQRGIEKLTDAVLSMQDKCRSVGVDLLYLISTAALRAVLNFEEVHSEIYARTGIPLNFIDGETEAYCDYVANRAYGEAEGGAVLLDFGGASTEICDLSREDREGLHCLDFGIHSLRKKFVEKIQPSEEEAENIRKFLKKKFKKAGLPKKGAFGTVVLAGATNLALYAVYAEYTKTHTVGERVMDGKKFKKLTDHLLSGAGRAKLILDVAPDKLYAVGLAAITAQALVKRLEAERIVVSDRGVKEGYLALVRSGSFRGAYYDFSREGAVHAPAAEKAVQPAEEKLPAKKKKAPAKPAKEKESDGSAKEQPPVKRRGRPPKVKAQDAAENAPAEPAKEGEPPANEAAPSAKPAAKRGRKPAAKAQPAAEGGQNETGAPAKRRGRPPKAKAADENAAENGTENGSENGEEKA